MPLTGPSKPPVYLKDVLDPTIIQAVEDALQAIEAKYSAAARKK